MMAVHAITAKGYRRFTVVVDSSDDPAAIARAVGRRVLETGRVERHSFWGWVWIAGRRERKWTRNSRVGSTT